MNIIKIESLENGAHDNAQNISFVFDGWAVIPDSIAVPSTFPFVDITVDNSVPPVVLTMTEGIVPDPEPEPEPEPEATQLDKIEAQTVYTALITDTLIEEDA